MSKESGRAARRNREPRNVRLEKLRDAGVPKGKPKGGQIAKRLPMNMKEVRELLSAKGGHNYLRLPLTGKENRYWNKLWQFKGRPYNKPEFKGDSRRRKLRQRKQSKSWRLKREKNNQRKSA